MLPTIEPKTSILIKISNRIGLYVMPEADDMQLMLAFDSHKIHISFANVILQIFPTKIENLLRCK